MLEKISLEGGGEVGELIKAEDPGGVTATFVYAKDIEENIIELQSWEDKLII